jgi:hypothetical protein
MMYIYVHYISKFLNAENETNLPSGLFFILDWFIEKNHQLFTCIHSQKLELYLCYTKTKIDKQYIYVKGKENSQDIYLCYTKTKN